MVNWQSPKTLVTDYLIDVKLGHLTSGIYIWEWVTNLDFDYRLVTNAKTFKWSILVYIVCRLAALMTAILDMTVLDVRHKVNCQAVVKCLYVAGYVSAVATSNLIVLRTIAIWNQNKYVFVLLTLALVAYGALALWVEIVGVKGAWSEIESACIASSELVLRSYFTYAVAFDAGSLILALAGVRILWNQSVGKLCVALYHQGIIWLLIILVTYSVPLIFLWLNLNMWMVIMFQDPAAISLTIAATRMYRELYEVGREDVVQFFEPTRSGELKATNHRVVVEQPAVDCHGDDDAMAIEMKPVKSSARNT